MKICIKCNLEKNEVEFSWKIKNIKRSNTCKECHKLYRRQHYLNNRQMYIDKARRWEIEHGGKRKIRYGITDKEFEILKSKFNGKCWICKDKEATHIDHDHGCCDDKYSYCGKCVRGILCSNCNSGIGMMQDNILILQSAIEYLQS